MQLPLFEVKRLLDTDALERCLSASTVAIDIETETHWPGVGPHMDYGLSFPADITMIALAWNENGEIQTTAIAAPFNERVRVFLCRLFQSQALIIAHNAVFDLRQLSKLTNGLIPARIWDTYAMARLLSARVDVHYGLLDVAASLGLAIPEQQSAMKGQRSKLHLVPIDQVVQYAQADARLALEIYVRQSVLVNDPALVDWECRAVYEYCVMAARGIRLNTSYVEHYLGTLRQKRAIIIERLRKDGLKSPRNAKARAQYLYETKGVPLPKWSPRSFHFTRAGRRRLKENPTRPITFDDLSTNSWVIDAYLAENSPYREALQDLAAFQEVDWLISTLEGLLEHAVLDGRLHSLVTIATDTGRRASSNPHMQNWKMPEMAGVAIADDGFTLIEIDYRNAENVMAALLSGDEALAAACSTDDFHATMAARYFGAEWDHADADARKRLRGYSKRITYGTNYGMGADSLARSLDVTNAAAVRWIQAKDRAFPKVTRMRYLAQRQAQQTSQLTLWTGRVISVPSPFVAWNYLCQGGVAELLKRAIVVLSETFRACGMQSRVALDMHDALILEVAHNEWEQALELASTVMSSITPRGLHDATGTALRWIAAPDLVDNRRKWGATQGHPAPIVETR